MGFHGPVRDRSEGANPGAGVVGEGAHVGTVVCGVHQGFRADVELQSPLHHLAPGATFHDGLVGGGHEVLVLGQVLHLHEGGDVARPGVGVRECRLED